MGQSYRLCRFCRQRFRSPCLTATRRPRLCRHSLRSPSLTTPVATRRPTVRRLTTSCPSLTMPRLRWLLRWLLLWLVAPNILRARGATPTCPASWARPSFRPRGCTSSRTPFPIRSAQASSTHMRRRWSCPIGQRKHIRTRLG